MNDDSPLIKYVSLESIHPAQHRYASRNVEDKIKRSENFGFHIDEYQQSIFHFDDGKSIYPEKNAIPAIEMDENYILCDGHHSALASLFLGCKTIPVRIFQTIPYRLGEKFWLWAEASNYAYLINMAGERQPPPSDLKALEDDPLRYFAAISARKYENPAIQESFGSDYPLWIKMGKDVPFIEMRIADKLRSHGFEYHYGEEETQLDELIEKARAILIADPIPNLNLLHDKEKYDHSLFIDNLIDHFIPDD